MKVYELIALLGEVEDKNKEVTIGINYEGGVLIYSLDTTDDFEPETVSLYPAEFLERMVRDTQQRVGMYDCGCGEYVNYVDEDSHNKQCLGGFDD